MREKTPRGARQRSRAFDLVLTSMIPWISEKPWELAYDSGRQRFLATEEFISCAMRSPLFRQRESRAEINELPLPAEPWNNSSQLRAPY